MIKNDTHLLLVSFISHILAYAVLLTEITGLRAVDTTYFGAYLVIGILLCGLLLARNNALLKRSGRQIYAAGLGFVAAVTLFELFIERIGFMPSLWLCIAGLLLLRRLDSVISVQSGFREILWNSSRLEITGMLGLYLFTLLFSGTSMFQGEPDWQTKVLPLFVLFLLFRLYSLSLCMRLHSGNRERVSLYAGLGLLIIFAAIVVWTMRSWQFPIYTALVDAILLILRPVLYAIGYILQLLLEHLDSNAIQQAYNKVMAAYQTSEPAAAPPVNTDGSVSEPGLLLPLLIFILIFCSVWYLYRKRGRAPLQSNRAANGRSELRQFIKNASSTRQPKLSAATGPLEEMRQTYRRLLKTLRKSGHELEPDETAAEFAVKISHKLPAIRDSIKEITSYYSEVRYGGNKLHDRQARADHLAEQVRLSLQANAKHSDK